MDGLDLLLAVGDTVEKVHQSVWYALLRDSALVKELGLTSSPVQDVDWEPAGKLFDLMAVTAEGPVWIELKIDSELSEWQLRRQLESCKQGRVVHALLGLADIRSRPWATKLCAEKSGTLLDRVDVIEALRRVARSNEGTPAARQLAGAYAGALDQLRRRGEDFRTTDSWWSAHSLCFFDRLRQECPDMKDATVGYVANQTGGFEACHWGWVSAGGVVGCYLQWEHQRLCFKLSVEDRGAIPTARSRAADFLRDRRLGNVEVRRPTRLRGGQTMTVGIVDGLPVQEASGSWEELVNAMAEATRLNEALAEHLRAGSEHAGADAKQAEPVG